jgi:hypothetical protein
MFYLSAGDTIDLREIAKEINLENSKTKQSIDESKAEMLSRVG